MKFIFGMFVGCMHMQISFDSLHREVVHTTGGGGGGGCCTTTLSTGKNPRMVSWMIPPSLVDCSGRYLL